MTAHSYAKCVDVQISCQYDAFNIVIVKWKNMPHTPRVKTNDLVIYNLSRDMEVGLHMQVESKDILVHSGYTDTLFVL